MPENNHTNLVELGTVSVDRELPREERIKSYIRQIKNPYLYKCGRFTIIERYTPDGPPFIDCIKRVMV